MSPAQAPSQPTVESFLLHTVQQQQNQVAQLTALVQTLVSREPAVVQKGKRTGGDLSSITDSTNGCGRRRCIHQESKGRVVRSQVQFALSQARFPSFHVVCRCVFASFDSSTFWLLSLSALFAVLWFCLLCFTTGYCIHCQKAICVFRVHFRKTE